MTLHIDGMKASARASLNGQAPRCEHLDTSPATEHGVPQCAGCLALGLTWTRLLACLTCGWVACSDDSPGKHAWEHYQETDHPVVAALEPDPAWRWCYVHERTV
ncbi:UBP-type zinc finger domain-containing protein [Sphaerisporangium viridialbum]|uniref:UBP-type zinc finger domain-containing protein n=1 Tax=Sphaerisporangium viridialbum TaxID=46189 RepID=UPI003C713006